MSITITQSSDVWKGLPSGSKSSDTNLTDFQRAQLAAQEQSSPGINPYGTMNGMTSTGGQQTKSATGTAPTNETNIKPTSSTSKIGTTSTPTKDYSLQSLSQQQQQNNYSIDGYLADIGWDGTKDKYGRDAQKISYDLGLNGIDGGEFGYDEDAIKSYFGNMLPTQTETPTGNGMAPDGGQLYDTPTGNAPAPTPPAGNDGVDTTTPPSYAPDPAPTPAQPMTDEELLANAGINPAPGSTTPPEGGTGFNPGGGTNPDGTNPTVPQGNDNNNTAPSVYQLLDQLPDSYTTGDPQMDQMATAVAEGVMSGEIPWNDLTPAQRDKVLAGVDRAMATDPDLWTKWGNGGDSQFIKDAFVERYGDPTQQARGAADNTRNDDGSVQGQYAQDKGEAFQAVSSDAARNDRTVGENEMSSVQMNDILSQDSPLMSLARQQGVEFANRQGMRNSSLSAGAQMRSMAEQARPLAMQQADVYNRTGMQNQQLESARRDANASRQTQTSTTNAGMANDLMNADRQREMQYNLQQLAGDQDYAKQELAGQLAADIANIEGQYKQIISQNDTAARMFDSYYDTMAEVVSNPDFGDAEARGRIAEAQDQFEYGMQMILGFEEFELGQPVPQPGEPGYEELQEYLAGRGGVRI